MTPKEKSLELYHKYEQLGRDFTRGVSMKEFAKECALIAVDEIVLSRKDDNAFDDTLWSGGSDMYTMHPMYLKYWEEVKKEIHNI